MSAQRQGALIAFEGPDGSGKSTQRKLLKQWLRGQGYDVVSTKWNSSAVISPLIKAWKSARSLDREEYAVLHAADFQDRCDNIIEPALRAGCIVLADRYAYTGLARDVARGLDRDWVRSVYSPWIEPDITLYFSVSVETSLERITADRAPGYYEAGQDVTGIDDALDSYTGFTARVIQEYERLAAEFGFRRVDGERPVYELHRRVRSLVEATLPEHVGGLDPVWQTFMPREVRLGA